MTNFQDLVAKVKNLVALVPVLGAISRPVLILHVHVCTYINLLAELLDSLQCVKILGLGKENFAI